MNQNEQVLVEFTGKNARELYTKALELFLRKLNDYGTSDLNSPEQIIQRIKEKLGRIERLRELKSRGLEAAVADEREGDTAFDLIGYGAILALMFNKQWGVEGYTFREHQKDTKYGTFIDNPTTIEEPSNRKGIMFVQEAEYPIDSPKKAGDVGYDLYVAEDTIIPHNTKRPIDVATGVRSKLPEGYWALIINRSSTARKHGIDIVPGVIDTGYTGPLFACCWNRTGEDIIIKKGERLAQLLIFGAITPELVKVDKLPETERGDSGFGSTDVIK